MSSPAAEHLRGLAEFARWEKRAGGPDPQLETVALMSLNEAPDVLRWRIGCYAAAHSVPTAQVLWTQWPTHTGLLEVAPENVENWLERHWPVMLLRRERRAVRTPHKLAKYLHSWANFQFKHWADDWPQWPDYDAAWKAVNEEVYGLGRYMAIKVLEALSRYTDGDWLPKLHDIRATGGHSPREALALFYPQLASVLQRPGGERVAQRMAAACREQLAKEHDVALDWFELQVCLCEYKTSAVEARQYPGRSLDGELHFYHRVETNWKALGDAMFGARRGFAALEALGEVSGWTDYRKDLDAVRAEHGYTWRDAEFDYLATKEKGDFAEPVRRVRATA